ncbi:protein of unknown function (plasmid) [Pararobbsia alpina]
MGKATLHEIARLFNRYGCTSVRQCLRGNCGTWAHGLYAVFLTLVREEWHATLASYLASAVDASEDGHPSGVHGRK